MQGRAYTGPLSVPYICVHTYARTHTRTMDDGSYKRAVERLPGRAAAGGLWQSTQGLEAKRLIPQEALHPVLIRREFYERFERYCACMRQRQCICMSGIARGIRRAVHRRDIGRRERDLEQGALCRADDGRMTGKCANDDRVRETRSPERIREEERRETELRGKIVDFIQKIFIRQIQSLHF